MVELEVRRTHLLDRATLGEFYIDGVRVAFTLEDRVRPVKVYGETAIPAGRYQVVRRQSSKFRKPMPFLLDVPEFEGIMIHPGNTVSDTHGCILVGTTVDPHAQTVGGSRAAFTRIWARVEAALLNRVSVHITIVDAPVVDARPSHD